ncbi:MAG: response regulator [Gammaproteobacteria bacterium]
MSPLDVVGSGGHPVALIVEDDPTFETSMRGAIAQLGKNWEVQCFRSALDVLRYLESPGARVNLALIDIGLPDISGIEVVARVREAHPDAPIMVVSVIAAERSVLAAIRAGARGYVLKDDSTTQIAEALRETLQGNYPISPALARYLFKLAGARDTATDLAELTPKELALLKHLSCGRSYAEAAKEMGIALSTVQTHIRNLYRKLDVHSQVQAVTRAQERGLI